MTVPGEGHMTTEYQVGEGKSRAKGTPTWVPLLGGRHLDFLPYRLHPVGGQRPAVRVLLGSTEDLDFPEMQ